jgi:hypothetical protein
MNEHDIDQHLSRLARSTSSVAPASGFADWVMAAVEREGSWQRSMWQVGRVALVAFAMAAAAAALYSTQAQSRLDRNTLTAFDPVEFSQ